MPEYDLIPLLDFCDLPYREHGKNISPGWLGVTCPFCMGKGYHLGVNRSGYGFYCWQCGEKGYITQLIQESLGVNKAEARKVLQKFSLGSESEPKPEIRIAGKTTELPRKSTKWPRGAIRYILKRKFNSKYLTDLFQVYPCLEPGKYENRLIIPITVSKTVVCFTARDFTGRQEPKYTNSSLEKSILPVRSTLYGIDEADEQTAVLVEGPTDRWRLGPQTLALMGKTISDSQVQQLFEKSFKRVFIVLDAKEEEAANKIADRVKALFTEVNIVSLSEGDPGDLSKQEAQILVRELFSSNHFI